MVRRTPSFDYGTEAQWFKLPNGLTVGMLPDPQANLVSVDVRYKVGAASDPTGKPGLAHAVEHMTYATRAAPGGPTLGDRIHLATLDRNASTGVDATHYYEVALAPQLDQLLEFEATRLESGCRGISQAVFERELAIVALELRQRSFRGMDAVLEDVFGPGHPYAHRSGGSATGLTLDDACKFLADYYAPDRAVLIVGGRFEPRALRAAIESRFGRIAHRAAGAFPHVTAPMLDGRVSQVHVQSDRPRALVVLPAAPWGSLEALDDALLDELLVRRIDALATEEPWILGAEHGRLGGAQGGVRYIAVRIREPARLSDAASLVFAQAKAIADRVPAQVSQVLERHRVALLDRFEPFISRARLCADALQFADNWRCRLIELREMSLPHTERVAMRALVMSSGPRRVIHLLTEDNDADGSHEIEMSAADAQEAELPVWQAPADPAEADQPIALPNALQNTNLDEFVLPNGLRVVMASHFTQPMVDIRMVLPVGMGGDVAQDIIANAAARLLEHDLSRSYPGDDLLTLRSLFGNGATMYAGVTDHTTFRIHGPTESADWHLWRLAWLLRKGVYSSRTVALVRKAAAASPSPGANLESSGAARLSQALRQALFGPAHPFSRPRDEEIRTALLSLNTPQLAQFRDRHYVPAGAALVITGSFDPVQMRARVIAEFGDWKAPAPPANAAVPSMQPVRGPTWIAYDDRSAPQVQISFEFAATSSRLESRAARAVLRALLQARVELIRSEMLASYGVESEYRFTLAGDVLQIHGLVSPARAGDVLRRLLAELDRLRAGDAGLRSDFVRARRAALAAALADPSSPSATGSRIERALANHAALDRSALAAEVASTTLRDLSRLIAQDLPPARMVGLLSGRPADVAAAMRTAGISAGRTVHETTAAR